MSYRLTDSLKWKASLVYRDVERHLEDASSNGLVPKACSDLFKSYSVRAHELLLEKRRENTWKGESINSLEKYIREDGQMDKSTLVNTLEKIGRIKTKYLVE